MPRTFQSRGCAATGLRRLGSESGSTLVEFAFVFMILMTMILGIIEFSRALYAYHFVASAARQTTRWAAVNGSACNDDSISGGNGSCTAPVTCASGSCSPCTNYGSCTWASAADVQNYVVMLAQAASIDSGGTGCGGSGCLTTTATWPVNADSPTVCSTTENSPGCTVQVQVSYNFNFLVPFIHNNAIKLSSTSQMIISH